jgi:hypothetical protein
MGTLGNQPNFGVYGFTRTQAESFNGTGSATSFTLGHHVKNAIDIEVLVDNVQQSPFDGSYSVSGTTLTFSGAPASGTNNVYVMYRQVGTVIDTQALVPDDNSVTYAKLGNDIPLGNRNLIINGNFSISQRGVYTSASGVSNGVYYLDRWKVHSGVAGTLQDTGYKVKVVATSTASGVLAISQSIEDKNIHPHKGKVVTVSCKVTSNSSNARIVIYADDWMALGSQNDVHSGGGNEETLSATFTVPSNLSGILQVRVGFENAASNGNPSVSTNDYFEVSEVQLEVGTKATPFEHRSYGDELARCQRYYSVIKPVQAHPIWVYSSAGWSTTFPHKTTMRAVPSVSFTGVPVNGSGLGSSDGKFSVYSNNSWRGLSSITASQASSSVDMSRIDGVTNDSMTPGHSAGLYMGSNCSINMDAEL